MKVFRYITLMILVIVLSSCSKAILIGEKKSKETTTEQQEQVKTQVMKLLEKEYKQPFKLESFDYKYESHWEDNTCQLAICPKVIYGTYTFKIKAIDNPIIEMNFNIDDYSKYEKPYKKESIKDLIDSFKKNQLNKIYCVSLSKIYMYEKENTVNQNLLKKAISYCNSRNQKGYVHWKQLNN